MKKILLLLILVSLSLPILAHAGRIVIIVNKNSQIDDISLSNLNKIYRGEIETWEEGSAIVVLNRDVQSPVRIDFYAKVLKAKPTRKFFLSNSRIPFRTIVQKSALSTTKFVGSEKNAIGYVFLIELTGDETGIKVLKVDGVFPTRANIQSGKYTLRSK